MLTYLSLVDTRLSEYHNIICAGPKSDVTAQITKGDVFL